MWKKRFSGSTYLVALEDLNKDGAGDVAWFQEECVAFGEGTLCTLRPYVYSWVGGEFKDWIDGQPVARNARVTFAERGPGSGDELVVHEELPEATRGAEVPAREFIWTSDAGAPYRLYDVVYEGTHCLRYTLHEAEVALLTGPRYGWERAIERFTRALNDDSLTLCKEGKGREQEEALLKGLAYFHLALARAYNGQKQEAGAAMQALMQDAGARALWGDIAQAWWNAYQASGDMAAACQAAIEQARGHANLLADLNAYPVPDLLPSRPEGVCPTLLP